ncbi:ParB N-terminal domain-containing protein [Streptomyces malaysiensis]|uniref:ParB N-terminal domain-containing protein n=1 Tax=Streptomyces malaysiensis subsp. samsunensis TaxID=459658 RepID=A0A9X2RYZ0_STRMQ|nr:ParB N-terminal domain-containing protein [Streptomyces samsunensis]MCQ8836111.1 ParB N-terminal domain-containing protein [Streptomyces samsunensis]
MATAVSTPPTEPATHEEEDAPQIVLLDPALVVRDECNAREEDTEPDEDLINSVKEIGVEETISVRPRPDGTYGAFKGWRRAQAQQIANTTAQEDGRPVRRIKAHVREDLVGRDGWTRFLSLVENKHREGMSERDILKSQELSLIAMSDVERRQATKALSVGRNAAKQAKAAQKLDDATLRRATAGGMDLEQTAQLAEVENVRGAERRLLRALERDHEDGNGGRGHWDQEMALLKAEQADADARTKAEENLKTADIPLLGQPGYGQKDPSKPLAALTTGLGNPLTEDNHKNCPGHSARLDDEHQPVWHCSDPAAYGHKVRPQPKKPRTEEDEAKAEERRKVIACNRAWKAAAGPRHDFVTRLVRQKTLPDAARVFAQEVVLTLPVFYSSWTDKRESETVARFLGVKEPEHADLAETAVHLPKARVVNALFAHVAAACEHDIREPKTWSNLTVQQARYLLLLEALGQDDNGSYRLSEVEDQAVARHRPDTAA